MNYRFHPRAEAEHFQAIEFYESKQIGLGAAYLSEFEETMPRIIEAPHRYKIERKPNIRVASLKQFPFKVIFRDAGGMIQILAISHKRRRPGYWLDRL